MQNQMEQPPKNPDKKEQELSSVEQARMRILETMTEETRKERQKVLAEIEKFMWGMYYKATIDSQYNIMDIQDAENTSTTQEEKIGTISKERLEELINIHLKNYDFNLTEEHYNDVISRYVNRFCKMREDKKSNRSWWKYIQYQWAKYWVKVEWSRIAKKKFDRIEKDIDEIASNDY